MTEEVENSFPSESKRWNYCNVVTWSLNLILVFITICSPHCFWSWTNNIPQNSNPLPSLKQLSITIQSINFSDLKYTEYSGM